MVFFMVTYKFDSKEQRDGFYKELESAKVHDLCIAESGCLKYDYFYPCDDDTSLFLLEAWETPEAQKLHLTQPHMNIVRALKEKYGIDSEIKSYKCD